MERNAALTLDFSRDGQTLVLGTWSGNVKLVDVSSGKEKLPAPPGIKNNCCSVTLSPDGKLLAYVGGSEFDQARNNYQASGKVLLWDVTKGRIDDKLGQFKYHSIPQRSLFGSFWAAVARQEPLTIAQNHAQSFRT